MSKDSLRSRVSSGRLCAYEALSLYYKTGGYIRQIAQDLMRTQHLKRADRAFALLLATGVVATMGTLDELINATLKKPSDIKQNVRIALRLSAYELTFLQKESYAVVNEGVNLIKSIAPRATGVANHVLRRIAQRSSEFKGIQDAATYKGLSVHKRALLAGFPQWLVARLDVDHGVAWTNQFLATANQSAPLYFMINAFKADEAEVLELLTREHIAYEEIADGCFSSYRLLDPHDITHLEMQPLLKEGSIVVADLSAQEIAQIVAEGTSKRLLEIGSGRGSKSIMLQNAACGLGRGSFLLTTVEADDARYHIGADRLNTARVPLEQAICIDARDLSLLGDQKFDSVFVDTPCSGTGTMRRHPETRWNITEEAITELSSLEEELLSEAAHYVEPGGVLTYSTCSVMNEENQQVVERFLQTPIGQSFVLVSRFREDGSPLGRTDAVSNDFFAPVPRPQGPDCHFACQLRRNASC